MQIKTKTSERHLLECYRGLDEASRKTLLEFAEFLRQRIPARAAEPATPISLERPAEESVVKAIKRLTCSYHMLDRGRVLNETAALMAQHVMHGRPAPEVIDELEVVFLSHYEKYRSESDS
ncbi:MAG: Crp/Fnr family transcriptional regulator [Thiotrichales bacterium]